MQFLPYEKLTYRSKLSSDEIQQKLAAVIETKTLIWPASTNLPYRGKIEGHQFEIRRVISYRNSFLPVIKGDIESAMNGSLIKVTMNPHVFAIIFMAIWFSFVGTAFFGVLISSLFMPIVFVGLIIPAGMLIFGYLLLTLPFNWEVSKSKSFLQELFQAEQELS